MINLTIITIGTLKEKYLLDAVAEYKKRLSQFAKVEEINIKEEKINNEDDFSEISRALDTEADKILAAIPKDSMKIALCVEGVQYDSVALASVLEKGSAKNGKIALVIGSSHGLSESVKRGCDLRLSISKLTFPHQMMRFMLMEILYRCFSITAGKRYHK